MFEPLSVGLCVGYAALSPYARVSSAISAEAKKVTEAASTVLQQGEASQSLFGRKALAISQLRAAVSESVGEPDQESVKPRAIRNAEDFLRALPDDLPMPEFSVDPDGSIALDWVRSRTRMLSVSVSEGDRLAYAWLDGSDRGHAVARFYGTVVPPRVLAMIRSIVGDGAPALRAA